MRVNTRLREAPRAKQTIFELAPESHGAEDYRTLVAHLRKLRGEGDRASSMPPPARSSEMPLPIVLDASPRPGPVVLGGAK